ncbi:MAG: 2Fe-2S iron-sulfur cluster binding domain-containing protein [Methylobacterium sp.]|nr:2Fe-2S iron-sulfur cluster binding domain-containing protein [Methylobacterium sp.]
MLTSRCFIAAILVGVSALQALAQMSGGGHAEHHPGTAAGTPEAPAASAPASPAAPPSNPPPAGASSTQPPMSGMGSGGAGMGGGMGAGGAMGGMMGGMGGMGEMMGRPRKEFYPSLMDIPALSAEQRQSLEAQARAQISAGTDGIASAENALRHANAAGDAAAAEQATSRLRDALNQVKSGATTLRSLTEGKPPQQIAQDWFKTQLNIPTGVPTHGISGPLGLSWFHVITMSLVAALAAAMLAIYLVRMRRANALVNRLTSATPVPASAVPAPPAAASPVPPVSPSARVAAAPAAAAPSAAPAAVAPGPGGAPTGPAPAPKPTPGKLWKGKLRVAAIFPEATGVKTFRLRDPGGGPIPFTFVPGQFLTYSAEIDGKLVRRSYTIASSAAQTAYVETTIKREEPGIFSDHMHDHVVEGDLVDVMGPSGVFTFTGAEADSVVLIGGGVGITPLMAAIRYLFDIAWPGEIFLVYGAQTTAHFIFRDELEFLQRRMRNLHVAATMARAAGTHWMGAEGHITREFLAQSVPEVAKRRVHLCGPPGMMEAMKKLLAELGVPPEQVKTEAFGPALGAVPPPGATVIAPIGAPSAPPVGAPPPPAAIGPATATIRFARSDKTAPLPPDRSVLEVSEDIGVNIDYSCRVGICGVCKTQLLEGKVTMEVEDALTPEDKARNIILACQAKSVGNLVVEA